MDEKVYGIIVLAVVILLAITFLYFWVSSNNDFLRNIVCGDKCFKTFKMDGLWYDERCYCIIDLNYTPDLSNFTGKGGVA